MSKGMVHGSLDPVVKPWIGLSSKIHPSVSHIVTRRGADFVQGDIRVNPGGNPASVVSAAPRW